MMHGKHNNNFTAHTIAAEYGDICMAQELITSQVVILSHLSVEQGRRLFVTFGSLYQAN